MFFDDLQPLHGMDRHNRCLLGSAGMLHDIGWADGTKRHNTRSARRIFSEESLPFDVADRSTVGLIALAHRGNVKIEAHPLFCLLSAEQKRKVLLLSAILRIADGLDYHRTGAVQEVHSVIEDNTIFCNVIAEADITQEKERARLRSALFVREFGRELVIR
jgi:exopolyphosphatase/guanosine-5'-triphosphate,3'-diphosphate pyrophosphatase